MANEMDDFDFGTALGGGQPDLDTIESILGERLKKRKAMTERMGSGAENPLAQFLVGLGGGVTAGLSGQSGMAGAQAALNAYQKGAEGSVAKRLKALDKETSDIKLLSDIARARTMDKSRLRDQEMRQQFGEQNLFLREQQMANRRTEDELKRLRGEIDRETKSQESLEKKTEKLGKAMKPIVDIESSLTDVVQLLGKSGVDLDTYQRGQKVDLPGVSVPILGRVTAYDSDARELKNTMDKIFNVQLKERSGAAVTDRELRNLQQEFSQGRFNTEEEMILALQRFKRAFEKAKANVRGSFNENVVKSWESGVERESTAPILRKRMDTAEEGPARAAQPGARRMGPDGILREKGADGKWHPVQ